MALIRTSLKSSIVDVVASESFDNTGANVVTRTIYTATESCNCTVVASIISRPSDTLGGTITVKLNGTGILTVNATTAEVNVFDIASISLSANDVITIDLTRRGNSGRIDGNCTVIKT